MQQPQRAVHSGSGSWQAAVASRAPEVDLARARLLPSDMCLVARAVGKAPWIASLDLSGARRCVERLMTRGENGWHAVAR